MPPDLDRVRSAVEKNAATSYGLTIVAGLPLPAEIGARVRTAQQAIEAASPRTMDWYAETQLHATLLALLRGRYRAQPPLQRDELPQDLDRFVSDLVQGFAAADPFALDLAGVRMVDDGLVVAFERVPELPLIARFRTYLELDTPKHARGLHVSLGCLKGAAAVQSDHVWQGLQAAVDALAEYPVGRAVIDHVWLVHYSNRTLSRIVGKVLFKLGQATDVTKEHLLRELGIQ